MLLAVILVVTTEAVHFNCLYKYNLPNTMWYCYECSATITLTDSNALESVIGDHDVGRTNDNVEYLTIKDQFMPYFPERLLDYFKILKAVGITNTQLLTLSATDLQEIPGLLHVSVQENNLISLDGDLFSLTPHLKYFAADFNRIEHVGTDFFIPDNMTFLLLGFNVCVNVNAQDRSEVLRLARSLPELCPPKTRDAFAELAELQALNLALNAQVDLLVESGAKHAEEITKLQETVSKFDGRMLDIEEQLKGSSSVPRIHWLSSIIVIAVLCKQLFK